MTLTKTLLSTALIASLAACSGADSDLPGADESQTESAMPDSEMSMENETMSDDAMDDTAMDDSGMSETMEATRGEVMKKDIMNPDGETIGTVTLTSLGMGGTEVKVDVSGLEQGTHALHFHQTGKCEGPDFTSAGGHFNPTDKEHGFDVAGGPHAGDMENIDVGINGEGVFTVTNERVSIRSDNSDLPALLDADGAALMIHQKADDYTSQPSGAAGARVGCAVIKS
ncbi:superoxide dismutase family protein [Litorimonas haliclonae]|uniref:superoxide dismutase family protein n=1 Tax=Litorimonas haliclonae TaxID=2081977 RepID=UPI0039F0A5BF